MVESGRLLWLIGPMIPPSTTRAYRIASEPRGPALEGLLTYCAVIGSYCSLVDQFPLSRNGQEARKQFLASAKPYLIRMDDVKGWPGTFGIAEAVPLWRFTLDAGLIGLLIAEAKGLYSFKMPKLPEDLTVYRSDGSVLLGSVAHEHMGWMELTTEERDDRRLGLVELRAETR